MDYFTALILGLVGSLHCAGMCGPLVLAWALQRRRTGLVHRAAYNAGRLITYGMLGLVFGAFGRTLFLAGFQRWLSLCLGVVLLAGLLTSRRLALWSPVTRLLVWLKRPMAAVLQQESPISQGILGLLNGLLPCGLVYVACAGAAATGGVLTGGLYMMAFGAGTVPTMIAMSFGGSLLRSALRLRLARTVPVAVALLGMLLILRGMALGIPYLSPDLCAGRSCCR